MKWSEIKNKNIKDEIAMNRYNFDVDNKGEVILVLTDTQIQFLDSLSEDALFNEWCNYNGFINWGNTISSVFREIHSKGKGN